VDVVNHLLGHEICDLLQPLEAFAHEFFVDTQAESLQEIRLVTMKLRGIALTFSVNIMPDKLRR
jgi:hypothetical protein